MIKTYPSESRLTPSYIQEVWKQLVTVVKPTYFISNDMLSQQFSCEITIATETFQYTGSFKYRGAYNLLAAIPHKHVVVTSSGNFGQGVAYAAKLLGKRCSVIMDSTTPQIKCKAIESLGGSVIFYDANKMTRKEKVEQYLQQYPDAFFSNSYEDYRIIVGNSTLGNEIFAKGKFDAVIVPIGGGGLISGMVVARDMHNSKTEIIGVEPQDGNDAARSLQAGKLIENDHTPITVADGVRTIRIGQLNWEIIQSGVSNIFSVPEPTIVDAVRLCFSSYNLKVEPTGALTIAALVNNLTQFVGKRVCCVISGGNVEAQTYAQMLLSYK